MSPSDWDWSHFNGVKIEWGTIPAAVSSLLTAGSLMLGFYILLRDRRHKEEEQARKVSVWLTSNHQERWHPSRGPYKGKFDVLVAVNNSSTAVIRRVMLHIELLPTKRLRKQAKKNRALVFGTTGIPDQWGDAEPIPQMIYMSGRGPATGDDNALKPGDQAEHNHETNFDPYWYSWRVTFEDGDGQPWWRDVITNELHKGKLDIFKPDNRFTRWRKKRNAPKARAQALAKLEELKKKRELAATPEQPAKDEATD